jgi:hypothetical protein
MCCLARLFSPSSPGPEQIVLSGKNKVVERGSRNIITRDNESPLVRNQSHPGDSYRRQSWRCGAVRFRTATTWKSTHCRRVYGVGPRLCQELPQLPFLQRLVRADRDAVDQPPQLGDCYVVRRGRLADLL